MITSKYCFITGLLFIFFIGNSNAYGMQNKFAPNQPARVAAKANRKAAQVARKGTKQLQSKIKAAEKKAPRLKANVENAKLKLTKSVATRNLKKAKRENVRVNASVLKSIRLKRATSKLEKSQVKVAAQLKAKDLAKTNQRNNDKLISSLKRQTGEIAGNLKITREANWQKAFAAQRQNAASSLRSLGLNSGSMSGSRQNAAGPANAPAYAMNARAGGQIRGIQAPARQYAPAPNRPAGQYAAAPNRPNQQYAAGPVPVYDRVSAARVPAISRSPQYASPNSRLAGF